MMLALLFNMAFAAEDVRDVTVKGNEGAYKAELPKKFEPRKKPACPKKDGDNEKCAEEPPPNKFKEEMKP